MSTPSNSPLAFDCAQAPGENLLARHFTITKFLKNTKVIFPGKV